MASQNRDDELVNLAIQGSTDAFDTLVERYQDKVFNLLLRMNGSETDAEELCQDTFIRAWRALSSFRQGSRFFTWLYRIALNAGFSQRRDRARRQKHEAGSLDAPSGQDNGRGAGSVGATRLPDGQAGIRSAALVPNEIWNCVLECRRDLLELDDDYQADFGFARH